ncbi:hypothetical protein MTO96_006140 [Rhipicephalus appendiculatus]
MDAFCFVELASRTANRSRRFLVACRLADHDVRGGNVRATRSEQQRGSGGSAVNRSRRHGNNVATAARNNALENGDLSIVRTTTSGHNVATWKEMGRRAFYEEEMDFRERTINE